ncbi:MAG: tetratricopeptide repeat protein [Bryobacterales bacterium]|nr:tetratricopeptide repeat protein [Bryobacterales bacterium]MBV9398411.1 tetratricopeptide repeat protein [Bryobacterales bacterium]
MIRVALFALISLPLLRAGDPIQFRTITVPEPAAKVSSDLVRHPINEKARHLLLKALETMNTGDHESAIEQLLAVLAKYPESAAYVHSLVGVEYIKTGRYPDAINSFEQAVALLPHDAVNRYNLGLSFVCNGDFERGAQEVRRALQMYPGNQAMRALLDALIKEKLISPAEP